MGINDMSKGRCVSQISGTTWDRELQGVDADREGSAGESGTSIHNHFNHNAITHIARIERLLWASEPVMLEFAELRSNLLVRWGQ